MRSRRWLTLGIGVKRYILLIFAGTVILALALAMFLAYVYRTIDVPGPAGSVVSIRRTTSAMTSDPMSPSRLAVVQYLQRMLHCSVSNTLIW